MELQDRKCVMILNEELPAGVLANTAGILGITLGKKVPENIGPDIYDKDGREHLGIVALPVPVLKADKEKLKAIRERLYQPEFAECVVVDFTDVAQCCQNYEDYIAKAAGAGEEELTYLGIGICGSKKTGQPAFREPAIIKMNNRIRHFYKKNSTIRSYEPEQFSSKMV